VSTTPDPSGLTDAQRGTLQSLTRCLLPHLSSTDPVLTGFHRHVEEQVSHAPGAIRRDLALALEVLGNRWVMLLLSGRFARFADMTPGTQAATFARWGSSPVPLVRSLHQALRRFVLAAWYARPEGRADTGARPPLHLRSPAVPWEGPLPGHATRDDEPVARASPDGSGVPGASPLPRSLPDGVITSAAVAGDMRITTDVVVIGSGAGGAVAATRMAEAGRQVVILESGEYLHAPDFNEVESDMAPRLFADRALRTTVDGAFALLQGGAVGGGTTVNWMLMLRPPESVLDSWARIGISGLSMKDLTPHLERIEGEVHSRPAPADAHSPSNRAILDGARRLGWRARAGSLNANGCVQAGTCSLGCRYDAKQSALLTWLPRAFAHGARLYANAEVERIEVLERDTPSGGGSAPRKRVTATVRDPQSREVRGMLTVEAPVVILAAGAVGTPVILEKSGLGGGGVGRFLRLHPTTALMGHYPFETYPLAGIPQTALCDEFLTRDEHGFGFWIECPALQAGLAAAALPGFGAEHRALMRQLGNTVALIVLVRDGSGSDRSSGCVWVDRRGFTRIRYRMTAADRRNAHLGIEATARLHLAAGATEVLSLHTPPVRATTERDLDAFRSASVAPNRMTWFSAHVNGTCRLGVNPATSGVTPDAERHGVRGLYVCDGSILPTSLGVNPQETIMALASLISERIFG